jgi:hypothetical protein
MAAEILQRVMLILLLAIGLHMLVRLEPRFQAR